MNLTVTELLLAFLQDRSFAGRVANALPHVSKPGLGTMAIGLTNGRLSLFTDPEFVARVSLPFGHFCMEHEILGHYTSAHIPRCLEFMARFTEKEDKERARRVLQIAADCAANSLLRKHKHFAKADAEMLEWVKWAHPEEAKQLPEGTTGALILPERYEMPDGKSFEWYLGELLNRTGLGKPKRTMEQEEYYLTVIVPATDGLHTHDMWPGMEELSTMSPEQIDALAHQLHNQTKVVLKKVVKEMKDQRGRGLLPGDLEEWLDDYLADPIVPWWELFATRIHTAKRIKIERGIERPNRMLQAMAEEDPSILPSIGSIKNGTYRIFFLEDVSGSMGTDAVAIGRSELQHILDMDEDMQVRWVQFDTQATFDKVFEHGERLPTDIHGRGGTDFDGAFKHIAQYMASEATAPDLVIVYTDGYAPAISPEFQLPPEIPVIWCITRDGAGAELAKAAYGEVIVCSPDQNELWKHQHGIE